MKTKAGLSYIKGHPKVLAGIFKRVGFVALFLLLMAAILFLAAGRLNWVWAWIYLGLLLVSSLVVGVITIFTNPDTVAERGEMKITRRWDQIISVLYLLAMYFSLPLVSGLDMRFNWTRDLGIPWHLAGVLVLVVGEGFTSWAMIANAYFSTAVRIQTDRGHAVCSSGPYRFVRHPGYVGFILFGISVPFLLGTWWGLIPAILAAVFMTLRTSFEDRLLQTELPGYPEYSQKVRFRLFPGVW